MTSYLYCYTVWLFLANHRYLPSPTPAQVKLQDSNQDLMGIATAEPSQLFSEVFWANLPTN